MKDKSFKRSERKDMVISMNLRRLMILLRATMFSSFKTVRYGGKKKASDKSSLVFVVVIFGFLFLSMYSMYVGIAIALRDSGSSDMSVVPAMGYIVFIFVSLLTSIGSASGYLLAPKDMSLLASMPFTGKEIFLAKLSQFYIYELVFSVLTMLPAFIVYFTYGAVSVLGILLSLVVVLMCPVLPMMAGTAISFLISRITKNMKHKNLINTVLSVLAIIAYIIIINSMDGFVGYAVDSGIGFTKYFPLAEWVSSAAQGDVFGGVCFALLSIIPLVIILFFFTGRYVSLALAHSESGQKVKKKYKAEKTNKVLPALIKKELRFYFNTGIYVINTMAMQLVIAIALTVSAFQMDMSVIGDMFSGIDIEQIAMIVFVSGLGISVGAGASTSVCISVEGSRLVLLKSLPVKPADIFISKAAVTVIPSMIVSLVAIAAVSIALKVNILTAVLSYILLTAIICFFAFMGLVINLWKPKLEWTNISVVIKQSMSVFIQMLISFVVMIAAAVAMGALAMMIGTNLVLIIATAIFGGGGIALYSILGSWGARKLLRID